MSYRKCVVAVIMNPSTGNVLVGKRSDTKTWQFPQGGIDLDEEPEAAVRREMTEEIGVKSIEIIKASSAWFNYDFPTNLTASIAQKYKGQSQKWFLCHLFPNDAPDLDKAIDKEFCELRWVPISFVLQEIVEFKRPVYTAALQDLNLQ